MCVHIPLFIVMQHIDVLTPIIGGLNYEIILFA
jgi:hypothetical protein